MSLELDLNYLKASVIMKPRMEAGRSLQIVQVGAGGTGSWLAPHLCRLAKIIADTTHTKISLKIIDPDYVDEANLARQNFCWSELGKNKAETLAFRYGTALGVEVMALAEPFHPRHLKANYSETVVLVGCVDNHLARRQLAECLTNAPTYAYGPQLYWLDLGNYHSGGQLLLGTTENHETLLRGFPFQGLCTALPSPALQHPELLEPEELSQADSHEEANLSCEELTLRSTQSLTINQSMAAIASTFLVKLFSGRLKYFQTYLNLEAMVSKSTYITPAAVGQIIGEEPRLLTLH
jgi:PRTRC genetic system ThiF family protein